MGGNKNLAKAKVNKNDEYYTRLEDIEIELKNYKEYFKNKIIFCNCDDPYESNFFKYFAMNFNAFGLKKLVTTCYAGSPMISEQLSLFDVKGVVVNKKTERNPYKIEITEVVDENNDGAIDLTDVEYLLKNKKNTLTLLKGDGDFRSDECVKLLKEADIVVTNPPFSLFSDYLKLLISKDKKFLILGNPNALHYKNVFPLVKNNKVWIGYKSMSSDMYFIIPEKYKEELKKNNKEGSGYKTINGEIYGRSRAIWYTNLDIAKRHEKFICYKKYTSEEYPKFDNFDAINIDKVSEVPIDYYDVMGVPDSFLDKYNPDEFEILGRSGDTDWVFNECPFFTPPSEELQNKYKKDNKTWRVQNVYLLDENKTPNIVYSRIFIKRKRG